MADRKDYYKILGITDDEKKLQGDDFNKILKKKFRKLSVEYHPDKNQGDKTAEEKFKNIAEAYEVLKDPNKRSEYDNPASNFKFDGFGDMGDIFSHFAQHFGFDPFGGMGGFNVHVNVNGANVRQKGSTIRGNVNLTLEEIFTGVKKKITYDRFEECDHCHGTGMDEHSKRETCARCGGTGSEFKVNGGIQIITTCSACGGSGIIIKNPCSHCGGNGLRKVKHEVEVDIPKGVVNGMMLSLSGEGNRAQGENGAYGDLIVVINEKEHEKFIRFDNDLRFSLRIPLIDALIGCEREVTTIDNRRLKVKIPPCTEDGTEIMFKGEGLADYASGRRGNMVAVVIHIIPKQISNSEKEILMSLKDKGNFAYNENN